MGSRLGSVGIGFILAAAVGAPLLAGGVHRGTLTALILCAGVGLSILFLGRRLAGGSLRVSKVALLPLVFLAIPVLQSIPLPLAVRGLLDPNGTALLSDHALNRPALWPLSLDPTSTRAHIGKAAAALAVFIAAYHLSSGRKRRNLLIRAVGLTGVAAVLIGIGHTVFGFAKIYGILSSTHRTLLIGPFVNANHTAELLELAAFACLACSFERSSALNRVGWLLGTVLCAGGAASTLSRGAVLATLVAALVFVLLWWRTRQVGPGGVRWRASFTWGAGLMGVVVVAAVAFGAGPLIDRFRAGGVGGDLRFQLWGDSLRVIGAHPFGVGRGAFDRVFPVYRTLKTFFSLRFGFVENQPLQLLIDAGWLWFGIVLVAMGFVAWRAIRRGRRDNVEAALLAGLIAVLTHNLVDFGLETLGVLLPFMAVLGSVLGRTRPADAGGGARASSRAWPLVAATGACSLIGVLSIAHGSYDDFDAQLKRTASSSARMGLLVRAQQAHPVDYYYPLAYARLESLRPPAGGTSPRFRALNRALALCPGCETVHVEVARNLWALGQRGQALLEWRAAVRLQPKLLTSTLGELYAAGAKPAELASLATFEPRLIIDVADFLAAVHRVEEACVVLDQAAAIGVPEKDLLLTRAKLQLQGKKPDAARETLARAHTLGLRDPRLALLDAQLRLDQGGPAAADEALALLDDAAAQYPTDLAVQRLRFDLVSRFGKWKMTERALEGFKQALYHEQKSVGEAHLAAARIYTRMGRWTNALGAYRLVLADEPANPALWMEYGRAAETAGRHPTAREAFSEAARLNPNDPEIAKAVQAVDQRTSQLKNDPAAWLNEVRTP